MVPRSWDQILGTLKTVILKMLLFFSITSLAWEIEKNTFKQKNCLTSTWRNCHFSHFLKVSFCEIIKNELPEIVFHDLLWYLFLIVSRYWWNRNGARTGSSDCFTSRNILSLSEILFNFSILNLENFWEKENIELLYSVLIVTLVLFFCASAKGWCFFGKLNARQSDFGHQGPRNLSVAHFFEIGILFSFDCTKLKA